MRHDQAGHSQRSQGASCAPERVSSQVLKASLRDSTPGSLRTLKGSSRAGAEMSSDGPGPRWGRGKQGEGQTRWTLTVKMRG